MKIRSFYLIVILMFYISLTQTYTLEGTWILDQQFLQYTKNPNVSAQVVNHIANPSLLMSSQ